VLLISQQALKEDPVWLMDAMERWNFLNEIHTQIRVMYGYCLTIITYLENAKYKPYFQHFNALNNWYVQDKAIVKDILLKYKFITEY
jgi:hypothetical protein